AGVVARRRLGGGGQGPGCQAQQHEPGTAWDARGRMQAFRTAAALRAASGRCRLRRRWCEGPDQLVQASTRKIKEWLHGSKVRKRKRPASEDEAFLAQVRGCSRAIIFDLGEHEAF